MSLLSGIRFISKDKREVKGISSIINNNNNNNNDKYKNNKLTDVDVNDDYDNEKNNDTIFKKRKSHKKDKVSKSNKKHKSKKNGKNSTYRNDIHYLDDRNDKGKNMNHRRKRAYDSSSSSSDGENNDDSHKIDDHHVRTKYERNIGDNNNNNNDDDDDDDSVVDMNAIAREEEAKERVELKRDRDRVICRDDRREDRYDERYDNRYSSDNYHSRHDTNIDHGNNSNSNVTNKKSQFDADRFKSLINSLKNKNKIDMKDQDKNNGGNCNDNVVVDDDDDVSTSKKISKDVYIQKSDMNDYHAEKSRFFHDDNDSDDNDGDFINKINRDSNGLINNSDFTKQVPVVVTATTTTTGTTNQSAAALLRERLKRNKMTTLSSTTSFAVVTNGTNVPTSQNVILDNKEMVTLKAKLQQLQEGDKNRSSSKSGNKSESNGGGSYKKAHNNNDDMDDMDEIYKQNILRLGDRYKGSELSNAGAFGSGMKTGFDEESDIDMKMFERKKESNPAEILQRQIKQMMKSQHDIKTRVSSCSRCIDSSTFRNQLILMKTNHCIISIKIDPDSLDKYHLELSSIQHNHSIVSCDNDTIEEMDRLKSYIADMFYRELDKSVLFIETAIHFNHYPHAYIDIIPIERGLEAEASMYFREAFTSCDEEWAQHRKIINVTAKRPLHHAIPKHFEYLSCLWQCSSSSSDSSINKSSSYTKNSRQGSIAVDDDEIMGIVHPIESSASMDKDFCLDVVAGMLDLDPIRIRRKFLGMNTSDGRNNSISNSNSKGKCITIQGETIEKVIKNLKKMWEKYDIPTKLNGV